MLHPSFPLQSERLFYRTYEDADLAWLYALRQDEEMMRFVPFGGEGEDEIKEVLERRKTLTKIEAPGDGIMCVMVEKESGVPVGEVMLRAPEGFYATGEVGFILRPDFHGKGYATEGALCMMRLGIEAAGFHRMIGLCDAANAASMATLKRIGLFHEGTLRQSTLINGEWRDQAIFGVVAEEWTAFQNSP